MKHAVSILEKGYEHYCLHDVFAKIIPGSVFLYPILLVVKPGLKIEGFFSSLIFIGVAWIISFAIGTFGTKIRIIKDVPSGLSESDWHKLMVDFINLKDEKLMVRRNRYVVIKEATGNLAVALLSNIIFLLYLLIFSPQSLHSLKISAWPLLVIITIISVLCIYANWVHADRQYSFMKQALDFKSNPDC